MLGDCLAYFTVTSIKERMPIIFIIYDKFNSTTLVTRFELNLVSTIEKIMHIVVCNIKLKIIKINLPVSTSESSSSSRIESGNMVSFVLQLLYIVVFVSFFFFWDTLSNLFEKNVHTFRFYFFSNYTQSNLISFYFIFHSFGNIKNTMFFFCCCSNQI